MRDKEGKTDFERLLEASIDSGDFDSRSSEKNADGKGQGKGKNKAPLSSKRLKRVQVGKQDTLDLHGSTGQSVEQEIIVFFNEVRDRRAHFARIITGRNIRSKNGPVLKPLANELLSVLRTRREITTYVLEDTYGSYIVQL